MAESKAPKLNGYPDWIAAKGAIDSGFGYGTGTEPYVNAETARVHTGKASGKKIEDVIGGETTNEDLTKLSNLGLREKIGTAYAQAALAANRSAISTLGFDPTHIGLDTKTGPATIGGAFSPSQDKIWANVVKGNESSIVHESIHRGFDYLRKNSPEAKEILSKMPEESLVRYMMYKTMGDPEGKQGEIDAKQRQDAIDRFEKFQFGEYPKWKDNLNRLEEIAAELHKEKRPRGPR